jgi:choline dehydrogenase
VEFCHGPRRSTQTLYADREVVLCAGALQSPHLLQLSGIGDAEALRSAGIRPVHALPGVGANLQDHLGVGLTYVCDEPVTTYSRVRGARALGAALQFLLSRTGPIAEPVLHVGAFLKSDQRLAKPDIQMHLVSSCFDENLRLIGGFSIRTCLLSPESRGAVTTRTSDPFGAPVVQYNYLSTQGDRDALRAAVKRVRDVARQPAMKKYAKGELQPGPDIFRDSDVDAWVRATAMTAFHPVGSCRMGPARDAMAVTDSQLRVHGIEGLRVADASVMPNITSGNTNAPSMMIGEKAAELIREGRV